MTRKCQGSQDEFGQGSCDGESKADYIFLMPDARMAELVVYCEECAHACRVDHPEVILIQATDDWFWEGGTLSDPDGACVYAPGMETIAARFNPKCFNYNGTFNKFFWASLMRVLLSSTPE